MIAPRSRNGKARAAVMMAYATHVLHIREAIAQKEKSLAALENAIARYLRSNAARSSCHQRSSGAGRERNQQDEEGAGGPLRMTQ